MVKKFSILFVLFIFVTFFLQRLYPCVTQLLRQLSDASTDLKSIMAAKIPKEQERIKSFRKQHGATKIGEVTVDMVIILYKKVLLISSNYKAKY